MQDVQKAQLRPTIQIHALPAFEDNYLWLIQLGHRAIVVDPGDADVVNLALKKHKLLLDSILITHHHQDHIGGVEALYKEYACKIYAPLNSPLRLPYICASAQQPPDLSKFGLHCQVLELPGHTLDHLAYLVRPHHSNAMHLFSGDVLFSAGCGRIFEGSYAQMWSSLQQIQQLPQHTLIYPAHEYTLKNLQFAKRVEPDNPSLQEYEQKCVKRRTNHEPTLPTSLLTELNINPFLRCLTASDSNKGMARFISLRDQRNHF